MNGDAVRCSVDPRPQVRVRSAVPRQRGRVAIDGTSGPCFAQMTRNDVPIVVADDQIVVASRGDGLGACVQSRHILRDMGMDMAF